MTNLRLVTDEFDPERDLNRKLIEDICSLIGSVSIPFYRGSRVGASYTMASVQIRLSPWAWVGVGLVHYLVRRAVTRLVRAYAPSADGYRVEVTVC
jgi:hypothetical protein